nr:hypothetical protein [Tanacetum cinerariifolium]
DHSNWKEAYMPNYLKNCKEVDPEGAEVQEVPAKSKDFSKKKASCSTTHSESSAAGEAGLVDTLLNK